MAPKKPRLVAPDEGAQYADWNQYVQQATEGIEPYYLPLPPPPGVRPEDYTTEVIEVACPDGDAMDAVVAAQMSGNDQAAFVALFGEDVAKRLLLATAKLPFFVRAKLLGEVMKHYGMQAAHLGD